MTRILSAPLFDPGLAREEIELPEGLTLEQIVTHTLPGLAPADRAFVRVTLVSDQGVAVITPEWWGQVRPKPGVRVVIRLVPGNDGLRTVLLAVVSIAAVALAGPVAGLVGLGGSQFGISLTAMALNFLGAALVNSLVPPVTPEETDRRNRYTLSGWNNQLRPDAPVPWALGRHRYAPPFA
ncbi:MAG: phage tail protein, partial [Rhodobacteraceae bacterium]|nr:phage tail protein [Paracoccaceae bacterium]